MQDSGKICGLCGEDCSNRPRVKDARGRYYCQRCHDRARAARRPSATAPEAEALPPGSMLDELMSLESTAPDTPTTIGAAASAATCPTCGASLSAEAVLCVNCGHDLRSGEAMHTRASVERAPARPGRAVWPIVIGVLGLAYGGMLAILQVLGMIVEFAESSAEPAFMAGNACGGILGIAIAALLIVGSLLLLMRRQAGVRYLRIWSYITLVLSVLGMTCLGIAFTFVGSGGNEVGEIFDTRSSGELIAVIVAMLLLLTANLGSAIFLLAWFNRDKVQAEINAW